MKFGRVWWGEDEELDKKELHGEEPDWIESGYDDNNNDKDDIQLQKVCDSWGLAMLTKGKMIGWSCWSR